jgi:hypothetical protein
VPKKHTLSVGGKSPFHNDREATVTASLESVLAFYRRELGKLGWKEETKGAIVNPQRAALKFTTPDGPGTLTLGREEGKTTVKLVQRKPAEAAKARRRGEARHGPDPDRQRGRDGDDADDQPADDQG